MLKELPKGKTKSEHKTCGYHQKHPDDVSYAGCTCSSKYSFVKKEK